jgi:type IV secretion system protein VirB10
VQGVIDSAKRSGRIKGRAEIQMHFTRLVYPNGYMVSMISNVGSQDSSDAQRVEDKEGTVKAEGTKGRDAATIAGTTGTGTLIGLGVNGGEGAGIGAGIGAGVGLLTTMLTRGNEVRFEPGSTVDMVLQRPLEIDMSRVASDPNHYPQPAQRIIINGREQSRDPYPVLIPR